MVIQSGGVFLYFVMSLGCGYAIGSLPSMGFLNAWLLSILFVPIAYELLNPNFLMVFTVIGFSLGLLLGKSVTFLEVLNYFRASQFLQRYKKSSFRFNHQPSFSTQSSEFSGVSDGRKPEEILGLPPNFTYEELRAAYQRESNRTHPDKWANKPESIKKMMEMEQKRINWAFQQLKSPSP